MQSKKLTREIWTHWQKFSIRSLLTPLFIRPSLSLSLSLSLSPSLALSLAAVIAAVSAAPQATASAVTSWQFDPATNQLEIILPEGTVPKYSILNRDRIAIDLPNTEVAVDATQLYPQGMVRSVGVTQLQPGMARIVLNLAPGMAVAADRTQFQRIGTENRWVLLPSIAPSGPETVETQPSQPTTPDSNSAEVPPEPAPPAVANVEPNQVSQPTPNDQIQPITVPLVSLRTDEKPQRQPAARLERPPEPVVAAPAPRIIPFGDPLPTASRSSLTPDNFRVPVRAATGANFILPVGSSLNLIYPGPNPLRLKPQASGREVLLLQQGITDSRGNAIVPANTPVIGRFETSNLGSRFVTEAIQINGRNIPLAATSEPIGGRRPVPRDRSLWRNTGIGGAALFLLSGLSGVGLLLGAAAGAATTYVAAPQPATIQPGQVVQVQLTEDLPQFGF